MMRVLLPALALSIAAPAIAAESAPTVYQLSPAEIDAVVPAPVVDRSAPVVEAPIQRDRRPHGEVGMTIGTGGTRGVFGAVGVPIGDDGYAAIGLETGQFGARRLGRYSR